VAPSCRDAVRLIERLEHDASVRIAVLRENELVEVTLQASTTASSTEGTP
jgi:hypothetical protein